MSNEVTLTGTYTVSPANAQPFERDISVAADMSGNTIIRNKMSIATSATALDLGGVTTPHWAWFKNLDASNYIKIRNGAAGADLVRLYPGKECVIPLEPAATPYAIANTAACLLDYEISQQ